MIETNTIAGYVVRALDEKKGVNVKIIDISRISTLADYFIIVSGTNVNQVQALADNVEETLAKMECEPRQIEGYANANWILMDYRDVVVHIFDEENRQFYDLERIWRDGRMVDAGELGVPAE